MQINSVFLAFLPTVLYFYTSFETGFMNILRLLGTFVVLCCLRGTVSGAPLQALPDSVVTEDNVYRYMFSDTQKAEAVMEALRERSNLPAWELDYIEGDLWFNTGRYYRALMCYGRVLESDRAKDDNTLYMDMLHRMVSCYDCTRNDARKAEFMERLLRHADACGDKAMLAVALFNIGKSEYNHGSKDKGYRRMEKATRMMEVADCKNKYDNLRYHYNTLLVCYEKDRRGKDALRTLDALEKVVGAATGHEKGMEGLDEKERKALYGHRTLVYNILGRDADADRSYNEFISLCKPGDRDNHLVMPYLFDRRKYGEILRVSHLWEHMLRSQGDTVNHHMAFILRQLGHAYYEMGDHKSAADNFVRLATLRDSLVNRERQNAVLELAAVYESEEKDKTILRQRQYTYILLAMVLLVLTVAAIVCVYNRRIRLRNEALVRAVEERVAAREELLREEEECHALLERLAASEGQPQRREPDSDETGEGDVSNGRDTREKEQIRELVYKIDSRRLYLNPGLTQKDVLEFVSIPAYLFGAVFKRHTGVFFTEYINRKRMEYAVRMLAEHPEYKVEAIAGMCGIKSKQHFHRQFLEYTGLTPSTFKKSHKSPDNKPLAGVS